MSPTLIAAIIAITAALVFYSIGVLGEARRKVLKWRDAGWFAAGLVADTTGTLLMSNIASSGEHVLAEWSQTLMAVSGTLAIALMAGHLVFALVCLISNVYLEKFHRWSLVIYAVWLFSYVVGPLGLFIK